MLLNRHLLMTQEEIQLLIQKYLSDTASIEERDRLNRWYNDFDEDVLEVTLEAGNGETEETLKKGLLYRLNQSIGAETVTGRTIPLAEVPAVHRIRFLKTAWFRYAAAVMFLLAGVATLLYFNRQPQKELIGRSLLQQTDITPGSNRAMLTLADGSVIVLDSAANGQLALQSGVKIIKKAGSQLEYQNLQSTPNGHPVDYNTMSTPRGGQYQLTLPDGTRVWLNAESSVTYPASFTGKERSVKITGEVYFEVAQNKSKPFYVDVNDTRIVVLGTGFNINAYPDEETMRTTLLQGSIKVIRGKDARLMVPGQQAEIKAHDIFSIADHVNTQQVVAWKNGAFDFQDKSLPEIMRQLARWYNIEVVYKGKIPDIEFFGNMGRDLNLSQVLGFLKNEGVRFSLEDNRKLIVFPAR